MVTQLVNMDEVLAKGWANLDPVPIKTFCGHPQSSYHSVTREERVAELKPTATSRATAVLCLPDLGQLLASVTLTNYNLSAISIASQAGPYLGKAITTAWVSGSLGLSCLCARLMSG